jgi:uncharacterized protein YgiM (DUF1202 family)
VYNTVRCQFIFASCFVFELAASQASAACMQTSFAVLRSGPSKKHSQQGVARKYRPLRVVVDKGRWSKVADFRRKTFWIESENLTDEFECATVTSRSANTRTGPGTNFKKFPIRPRVSKYFSAKVLKEKKEWVKLEILDGEKFWIFKGLLWMK